MRCFVLLILFFTHALHAEGFVAGTLAHGELGVVPIEQLRSGDRVVIDCGDRLASYGVVHTTTNDVDRYVKITIKDIVLCVALDQRFYVFDKGWVRAEDLIASDMLLCADEECINFDAIEIVDAQCKMYAISVESHMFCVTKYRIIVHNAEPIGTSVAAMVLPICPPLGGAIFLGEMIAFGVAGVATYLIHKKSKQKYQNNGDSVVATESGGCPCGGRPPKHEDDEDKHPHGIYEDAGYHHRNSSGRKSRCPNDGQKCLDKSLPSTGDSCARIGMEDGKFVVLRKTAYRKYHGYCVVWDELPNSLQQVLVDAGVVRITGKIVRDVAHRMFQ